MAVRSIPLTPSMELSLTIAGETGESEQLRNATLSFSPPATPISRLVTITRSPQQTGHRLLSIGLPVATRNAFAKARATTIALDDAPLLTLSMRGMSKALEAVRGCEDSMLTSWGISKKAREAVATPASPITEKVTWLTNDDYPPAAIAERRSGTSGILWTIGIDGRAGQCLITRSSGSPDLDEAACRAIELRAEYVTAKDKRGRAVRSWEGRNVRWVLPE